ncbi:SWIM zinc finger domain-containing protein [Paenibacillus sp. NPDC058174]|uniref:SWIM zinc finger family protein n=1 Tax=Paenibacillus sp. NPDC058174 TaxID=3346366 RepID=UPI0036D8B930
MKFYRIHNDVIGSQRIMDMDYMLNDSAWRMLLEGVAAHFDELTIIRGFQLYKQGRVEELALRDDGVHVDARVKDNRMHDVAVALDDLTASECACSVNRACTHMAATMMGYAERCGRPIQALVNAHSTLKRVTAAGKPSAALDGKQDDTRGGTRGAESEASSRSSHIEDGENRSVTSATLQTVGPTLTEAELTELPVAKWHERFQESCGPEQLHIRTAQEANELLTDLQAMRPELPWALEQLFTLHALLFVLERMVTPVQTDGRQSGTFMGYHTQLALDKLRGQAQSLLEDKLALADDSSAYWGRLMETADFLRERMLIEDKTLGCFSVLYSSLWLGWLGPSSVGSSALYEEELRQLQAAKAELGPSLSRLPWTLAQCLILLYLARDAEALELLVRDGRKLMLKPEHLVLLLGVLERGEQWVQLRDWLVKSAPLLIGFREEDLAPYGNFWGVVTTQLPEAEPVMWRTLQEMLPFSRTIYEDALTAYGRWDRWIDLQMCMGEDPLSFRVAALKPIEKEAPELLLPFYHQAVERYVLQKNREGYQAAVKLLNRLAKLYAQLKKDERWEQFIDAFASRNSRQRALLEELRKGGLLS